MMYWTFSLADQNIKGSSLVELIRNQDSLWVWRARKETNKQKLVLMRLSGLTYAAAALG